MLTEAGCNLGKQHETKEYISYLTRVTGVFSGSLGSSIVSASSAWPLESGLKVCSYGH